MIAASGRWRRRESFSMAFDEAGRIRFIRDFRHVPYIGQDARFVRSEHA